MHLEPHLGPARLVTWRLTDADELLARHYYRQQEERCTQRYHMTILEFCAQLGRILVRDSSEHTALLIAVFALTYAA